MSNLPTRRQLQRELTHALLVVRSTGRQHRKVLVLLSMLGLFVGILVIAIGGLGTSEVPVTQASPPLASAPVAPSSPRGGQRPVEPTPEPATPPPAPAQSAPGVHVVARGDTLAAVALRHGVPIENLAVDNRLSDVNRIFRGQRLTLRPAPAGVVVVKPGRTLWSYALETGLGMAGLLVLNSQITNPHRITAGSGLRVRKS